MSDFTIEMEEGLDKLGAELEKTHGYIIELGRQLCESEEEVKRLTEQLDRSHRCIMNLTLDRAKDNPCTDPCGECEDNKDCHNCYESLK